MSCSWAPQVGRRARPGIPTSGPPAAARAKAGPGRLHQHSVPSGTSVTGSGQPVPSATNYTRKEPHEGDRGELGPRRRPARGRGGGGAKAGCSRGLRAQGGVGGGAQSPMKALGGVVRDPQEMRLPLAGCGLSGEAAPASTLGSGKLGPLRTPCPQISERRPPPLAASFPLAMGRRQGEGCGRRSPGCGAPGGDHQRFREGRTRGNASQQGN